MKRISLLFVIYIFILGCASMETTPSDLLSNPINYVYDTTLKKNQAFEKSLMWAVQNYSSTNYAIQYKDKETGKIIGKGVGVGNVNMFDRNFSYSFNIDVKDNKVRISFSKLEPLDKVGKYGDVEVAGLDVTYLVCFDQAKIFLDQTALNYKNYLLSKKDDF